MLSPEMYVDASLVRANVSGYGLEASGMTAAEFKERAIEENGLFMLTGTTVDGDGVEHENVRYFQSPEGRMPLSVPRQPDLPNCRRLVLPVHLLLQAPLLGGIGPIAGDVKLQDNGVVHHPVDGRRGGHGVGEDAFPFGEDQV